MCGINGIVGKDGELIARMNSVTGHRGPDYAGVFRDSHIALGHNLLAIREAHALSRQPYQRVPEWVLVFNGQIYNTDELRRTRLQGVPLDPSVSNLDTYLLYALIEREGWNFYRYAHGMYAIALYNTQEKVLRLYRDPTGQKPLYFSTDAPFVFSSEIKGILGAGVKGVLDQDAVRIAALMGYIPGEKTLFRNIHKVRPSEVVTHYVETGTTVRELFSVDTGSFDTLSLEEALGQSVVDHLQSRDGVVLNLSGGLDSSILLHEAVKRGHRVKTYSTTFDVSGDSGVYNRDAELAKRLSKDYGVEHTPIHITKELYKDLFIESYRRIEEPNYNISLPVYLRTAHIEGVHGAGHRVVLSGDGGDELFGGYPYYETNIRFARQKKLLTSHVFSVLKNIRNNTHFNYTTNEGTWIAYKELTHAYIDTYDPRSMEHYIHTAVADYLSLYGATKHDPAYDMMMLDRVLWLASENFIRSDKLYMGESMELRSPFAYMPLRSVADRCLSGPEYFSGGTNKAWLRRYAQGKLPDYITKRPDKTGWRAPVSLWYDDTYKELFLSIVRKAKNDAATGIIAWEKVEERILSREGWPKKDVHLYLSLAILSDTFGLHI